MLARSFPLNYGILLRGKLSTQRVGLCERVRRTIDPSSVTYTITCPVDKLDKTTYIRTGVGHEMHELELPIANRSVGEHEERRYQIVVP